MEANEREMDIRNFPSVGSSSSSCKFTSSSHKNERLHPMLSLGPVMKMWTSHANDTSSPASASPSLSPTPSPPSKPTIPVPIPPPIFSTQNYNTYQSLMDFDKQLQQEKVSVRLVEDKGLIVEPEGAEEGDDSSSSPTYFSPARARLYSCISSSFPSANLEMNLQTSSPASTVDLCESGLSAGAKKENSPVRLPPFTRTRNGSCSMSINLPGNTSATPLMKTDHDYKVEMTIKPPLSYLQRRQRGRNVHLCCALVLGFSASLFLSLTLLLAKVLKNRGHHPISIAFWRYMGILIPSVPLILFYLLSDIRRKKYFAKIWPSNNMEKAVNALALLVRVVLGSTAVIFRFTSLNYLSIADSSVISYSAPVFAAIFVPFCFHKNSRKSGGFFITLAAGIIAVLVIFLISRPPFLLPSEATGNLLWSYKSSNLKGLLFAILSMLCTSGVLVLLQRNLLEKAHFSLVLFVLGLWGSFEAGVLAFSLNVLKVPELPPDIVMLVGVAVLTFFGKLFILLAMQMGKSPGSLSITRSCDILFAFMWQYLFLKTEPDIFVILSGTLIIFAVWLISFGKWLNDLRSNNKLKNKLSFILF